MLGDRLKLGRLANALSLQDLSDALLEYNYPITKAALSKFEIGTLVPNETCMAALCGVMNLDQSFFESEGWPGFGMEFYRKVDLINKSAGELNAYLQIQLEQRLIVDKLLGIEPPPFQRTLISPDPSNYQEEIDELAEELRRRWGNMNQPVASFCTMLENDGWYVFELPGLFGVKSMCGVETSTGRPFLAFSYANSIDDTRFDMLRELGCAYIHCEDKTLLHEMTGAFSRALLLPRANVKQEFSYMSQVPDYLTLTLLKRRYGMSRIQIRMRLRELGLYYSPLKNASKTIARIQTRKLFDSKTEPLYFNEIPANFILRVMEAKNRGVITRSAALSMLPNNISFQI